MREIFIIFLLKVQICDALYIYIFFFKDEQKQILS